MDTTREYRVGDVWQHTGGRDTVLDVGPHIGPDWFGGEGVKVRGTDGRVRIHCTRIDRHDVLISREA